MSASSAGGYGSSPASGSAPLPPSALPMTESTTTRQPACWAPVPLSSTRIGYSVHSVLRCARCGVVLTPTPRCPNCNGEAVARAAHTSPHLDTRAAVDVLPSCTHTYLTCTGDTSNLRHTPQHLAPPHTSATLRTRAGLLRIRALSALLCTPPRTQVSAGSRTRPPRWVQRAPKSPTPHTPTPESLAHVYAVACERLHSRVCGHFWALSSSLPSPPSTRATAAPSSTPVSPSKKHTPWSFLSQPPGRRVHSSCPPSATCPDVTNAPPMHPHVYPRVPHMTGQWDG